MWNQAKDNVYVAGHRGFPDRYPENTLLSYQAAIDAGVDMVELDIRMTADGQLVLIHDATVDRTTDGSGPVANKTLEQLRALDAGAWKGEAFRGTRIPLFTEFLEMTAPYPDLLFNFEIKEYPRDGNEDRAYRTADDVVEQIDAWGLADRCVINAFDATLLEYIHDKHGGRHRLHGYYPLSYLHMTEANRDPYTYLYCACPFCEGGEAYDYLRSRGVQPWAGARVKDEATLREVIGWETPLVTCNNPETILGLLRDMGLHK
ncbi:hypothetical protein LJC63_03190 [Ruminococcaceae bacterium OttesenSCG-928-L11]|nr:hypothetical protein [Ruminococcaceae bacterium OttesenSCG-928-L11]